MYLAIVTCNERILQGVYRSISRFFTLTIWYYTSHIVSLIERLQISRRYLSLSLNGSVMEIDIMLHSFEMKGKGASIRSNSDVTLCVQ